MKTARSANTSSPFRPVPTPPGLTSPSFMLASVTSPPPGVKLSCIEFTEPLVDIVVDAPHKPDAAAPNLTSLPSMFPPGDAAVTAWSAPRASSFGLPPTSKYIAATLAASQITNMMANTA